MGFLDTATTITITAKLTKNGRERMLKETNTIFSHFTLGDSDANYRTSKSLPTGTIPTTGGNLGGINNADDAVISSKIYIGNSTQTVKPVEPNSSEIRTTLDMMGENVVSGSSLTFLKINKNDNTSAFTNLFRSFSLPILPARIRTFTATTATNGGWADTAFSGVGGNPVLLSVIDNNEYADLIDGKSIRLSLPIATGYTSSGEVSGMTNYDIYSTFPKTNISLTNLDNQYRDNSNLPTSLFGSQFDVSYLVSDDIQRPNNDAGKSWATGYDTNKPFSVNSKELINVNNVPSTGVVADKVIGVAYLEKGILAFTDPNIVNNVVVDFTGNSETLTTTNGLGLYYYTGGTYNVTVDAIENTVLQSLLCIAGRNEFYKSQNETIGINDDIRLSEIAICDITGDILAIGKFDRQVIKKKNDFVVMDVQIVV